MVSSVRSIRASMIVIMLLFQSSCMLSKDSSDNNHISSIHSNSSNLMLSNFSSSNLIFSNSSSSNVMLSSSSSRSNNDSSNLMLSNVSSSNLMFFNRSSSSNLMFSNVSSSNSNSSNRSNNVRRSDDDDNYIHIVYATDEIMVPLTVISVASIIRFSQRPMRLFFHIVLIGIHWDEDFINEMRVSLGGLSSFEAITWSPLPEIIRNMKVRKKKRQDLAAPANYARFYISKLFPLLDRFIYLDNDIFAIRAVDSLWSEDLGSNVFGLVHDCDQWFQTHVLSLGNYNISHPIVKRLFGDHVMNHSCHPNAGMMLVNQRLFNEGKYLEKIERLARLNQKEFLYRLGSQPLVVLTSWNNYSALPEKYNVRKHICDYNLIHRSSSSS